MPRKYVLVISTVTFKKFGQLSNKITAHKNWKISIVVVLVVVVAAGQTIGPISSN